jgi:histone H3/H4
MTLTAESASNHVDRDSADAPPALRLGCNLSFEELYRRAGLIRLDAQFIEHIAAADADLHRRLMVARAAPDAIPAKVSSELLIGLAPHVEEFIAELFNIRSEVAALSRRHTELAPVYSVKRTIRAASRREASDGG